MKQKILIFLLFSCFAFSLFNCRKKPVETPEQIEFAKLLACTNAKNLPIIPKKDAYIEGEIDGQYFSISNNEHLQIRSTLSNFLALGYNNSYAKPNDFYGNGFNVVSFDSLPQYQYGINITYPGFQGDSVAFVRYFDQFKKGNTFRFRKEHTIAEYTTPNTVDFAFPLWACKEPVNLSGGILTSYSADQTNSYFRVADVKEYKSPNGVVYKRDVTIEFDVTLGPNNIKRIKNGRLFFSY